MTKRLIVAFLCILLLIPAMALADAAPSKLGVKVIEAGAFSGDESLSTITFDEDLTYIGSRAFEGCKGLVTVYCFSDDVVIEEDAFDGVENALIYCDLDSTMEAYAQRKGLTVKYLNAFETECDTEDEDACVLLPITWRVKNAMPGRNVTSRFVYEVYRDDVSVYTSDSTSDTSFSYTPTEAGDYSVSITMSNSLTVTTLATGKVKVKDKLYMGSMDGEKIEWKVLTVSGNKALVISTKILKNASYFNPYWIKYKYTYWSGSYIGSISQNYRGSQPEDPSRLITGITPTHVPLADGSWKVAGSVELEPLCEALGIDEIESEEFDTLGGLVFSRLTAIPDDGSHPEVECFGLHIRVDELSDHRVEWATVRKLAPDKTEDESET
jgi:putative hemolysin